MERHTGNELPLIAEIKKPQPVEEMVLQGFGQEEESAVKTAIAWAWQNRRIRRLSQRRGAELCGMSASHFSNILAGDKYLPPHKINQYEWVVGNTALSQTIERFRRERESKMVQQMAQVVAEHMMRVA